MKSSRVKTVLSSDQLSQHVTKMVKNISFVMRFDASICAKKVFLRLSRNPKNINLKTPEEFNSSTNISGTLLLHVLNDRF